MNVEPDGSTVLCATHGTRACLAMGIGATEVELVLRHRERIRAFEARQRLAAGWLWTRG